MRLTLRRLSVILALALSVSCSGDDDGGSPTIAADIIILPNAPTVLQGGTRQLRANVVDAAGRKTTDQAVVWSSSNEAVATVSSSGLVTSVGNTDLVTIIAAQGELTASVELTITQQPAEIRVSPDSAFLNPGEQTNLVIEVFDIAGNPYPTADLVITSNSTTVIRLEGITVTALIPGEARVTIRAEDLTKTVPVVVRVIPSRIEVTGQPRVYTAGQTQQLTAVLKDRQGNTIPSTVTYTSTNPTAFSVSSTGLVTALGPAGSARIHIAADTLAVDIGAYLGPLPAPAVIGMTSVAGSPYSVAVNSSGRMIVALVSGGPIVRLGNVSPLGLADTAMIGSLESRGVTLNPTGTRGYVATDLGVAVVDIAANIQDHFIPRPGSHPLLSTFVTRDGASLLTGGDGGLYRISTTTRAVTDSVKIHAVLEMVQHPTQPIVYAITPSRAVEISLNNFSATPRDLVPPTQGNIRGIAISPDGAELYVTDEFDLVQAVNTTTRQVVTRLQFGGAFGAAVLGNYLVTAGNGRINYIDRGSLVPLVELQTTADRRPVVGPGGVIVVPSQNSGQILLVQ